MKKLTITTLLIVSTVLSVFTQTPQAIKYQAVVRDDVGKVLANDTIAFKLSILQGSISGTAVYSETQTDTTNQFGLISLQAGNGIVVSGDFSSIDWGADDYFLKVEMDINGGTTYEKMGTSRLLAVPYALHSETSGDSFWEITGSDLYYNNGNVGIGTANPAARLHIKKSTNEIVRV